MFKFSVKTIPDWTKCLYCKNKTFCSDLDLLAHFMIRSISDRNHFKEKKLRKSPLLKLTELSSFLPFLTKFQENKQITCQYAPESVELHSLSSEKWLFQLSLTAWDFIHDKTCKPQETSCYYVDKVVEALPRSSVINLQVVCDPSSPNMSRLPSLVWMEIAVGESCVHACWQRGH